MIEMGDNSMITSRRVMIPVLSGTSGTMQDIKKGRQIGGNDLSEFERMQRSGT